MISGWTKSYLAVQKISDDGTKGRLPRTVLANSFVLSFKKSIDSIQDDDHYSQNLSSQSTCLLYRLSLTQHLLVLFLEQQNGVFRRLGDALWLQYAIIWAFIAD